MSVQQYYVSYRYIYFKSELRPKLTCVEGTEDETDSAAAAMDIGKECQY